MNNAIVKIEKLQKSYFTASEKLVILNDLDLEIPFEKKIIITGESGCGKSTLLNIIAGLDSISAGSVMAKTYQIDKMNETQISDYRTHFLGLIFQFHYLLKDFSALENILLPALISGVSKKEATQRAKQLIADVGHENRSTHLPSELSGGERQRIAVARSLINNPELILADEPTGNLDPQNAASVSDLLFSMVDQYKKTLILVTHDRELAKKGDVCYRLQNGKLVLA
ncbi:MAG: ABC transporter ATP-binding protein [Treponemataceae bacterium]